MAKIKYKDIEKEIPEDGSIIEACEELSIPFGCENGICGTCRIELASGEENLNEKTENEKDITGDDPKVRLACQCKLKKGTLVISEHY